MDPIVGHLIAAIYGIFEDIVNFLEHMTFLELVVFFLVIWVVGLTLELETVAGRVKELEEYTKNKEWEEKDKEWEEWEKERHWDYPLKEERQ